MKTANRSWQSVTMNFIIKLSKFRKSIIKFKYDSIMIMMNKFIKKAYFISFYKEMRTKMSTTEHSQTNDQTEQLNQIVKQYLKCYVNYQQNNWVELLSTTQFTYNNSTQTFTEISLFQAEYNKNMQINSKMIKSKKNNKQAIQQDKKMQQIHK